VLADIAVTDAAAFTALVESRAPPCRPTAPAVRLRAKNAA
jgi:hypothetical protein